MITRIFPLLQTFPSTTFIFFLVRLVLETLLVLVFILFEEIGRSWPLIPDMPYLFFHDISLFPFLGPIARIGLFIPGTAAWCKPCHINAKRKIQLSSSRSVITFLPYSRLEKAGYRPSWHFDLKSISLAQ
jgi:hypothetical protein